MKSFFFLAALFTLPAFAQEMTQNLNTDVTFNNPLKNCSELPDYERIFSPVGFTSKASSDLTGNISFSYSIIDGFCKDGVFIPVTGGKIIYYRNTVTSNAGNVFNRLKSTKNLVKIIEDFSDVIAGSEPSETSIQRLPDGKIIITDQGIKAKNTVCFDKKDKEIFMGDSKCIADRNGLIRNGKLVSTHKYSFTINGSALNKVINDKGEAVIRNTIDAYLTNEYNYQELLRINMIVTLKKSEDNTIVIGIRN